MNGLNLLDATITQVSPLIKERKLSPVELAEACIAQAERFDPILKAFTQCDMTPWLCRPSSHDGIISPPDIFERWHLLHHALIAAAPLVLYGVALRKWHPEVLDGGWRNSAQLQVDS